MSAHTLLNSKTILAAAVSAALLAGAPAVAADSDRSFEVYGFAQAAEIVDRVRLGKAVDLERAVRVSGDRGRAREQRGRHCGSQNSI